MRILVFLSFLASFVFALGNGQTYILSVPNSEAKELSVNGKKQAWIKHPSKEGYKFAIISAKYQQKEPLKSLKWDQKR